MVIWSSACICTFRVIADAVVLNKKFEEGAQNGDGQSSDDTAPTVFLKVIMLFTKHEGVTTWSMALKSPDRKKIPLLHFMKRVLGMDPIGVPWLKLENFGTYGMVRLQIDTAFCNV